MVGVTGGGATPETTGPTVARLVLYVSRGSRASQLAVKVVEEVVARFGGAVRCEVLDVVTESGRAEADRVIFAPTLVKRSPEPPAWLVGDLGDGRVVVDLLVQSGLKEPQ